MRKTTKIEDCCNFAISKNGKCISTEYIDQKAKMEWKCVNDHTWFTSWSHIKYSNSWCPDCSDASNADRNRTPFADVLAFISSKNWKCYTTEYVNNAQPLDLECESGHRWEAPFRRIKNQHTDCPECAVRKKYSIEQCTQLANKLDFKCLSSEYAASKTTLDWECNNGHKFNRSLFSMERNPVCPECRHDDTTKYSWRDVENACVKSLVKFVNCPADLDGKIFNTKNINNQWIFQCICKKFIYPKLHNILDLRYNSCGCTKSQQQTDIDIFIRSLGINTQFNDRKHIGLELDIFIPDLKLAIEHCGLWCHSELFGKDKYYHLNKLNLCKEKDTRLITIFEDEWIHKQEQVKGYLKAILGKTEIKIGGRQCIVKDVTSDVAKIFHNDNHIQGHSNGKHIGLYFNDQLVALSTFSKPGASRNAHRDNHDKMELMRYTVKINHSVRGGLSKLIADFSRKNTDIKTLISYSDNRWSGGNIYRTLSFELRSSGSPSYYYFKPGTLKRWHRYNFTKHKIVKLFNANKDDTEWSIMKDNGYDRIWDCGSSTWVLTLNV